MKNIKLRAVVVVVALLSWAVTAQAQNNYNRGQHIEVAYEGWELKSDGTYDLYFGYHNVNWEEMPTNGKPENFHQKQL